MLLSLYSNLWPLAVGLLSYQSRTWSRGGIIDLYHSTSTSISHILLQRIARGMVKFNKKVLIGLRKVLAQHKNPETLGPDGHILYDAMADTVSSGGDFSALSTDPFSLPAACWRSDHPTVRAGLSALVSLEAILAWAENSQSPQTANLVLGPLRDGWFDIINWLEFSLPSKGPLPLNRAYFRVSINLMRHFFRLKKHLTNLMPHSIHSSSRYPVCQSPDRRQSVFSVSDLE